MIAFALDFKRFEIYSKDCDKELIHWHENDDNDPIAETGIISDEDYNENPVIQIVQTFFKLSLTSIAHTNLCHIHSIIHWGNLADSVQIEWIW